MNAKSRAIATAVGVLFISGGFVAHADNNAGAESVNSFDRAGAQKRSAGVKPEVRDFAMDCDDMSERPMAERLKQPRWVLCLGGGIYAALELQKLMCHHGDLDVTLVTQDDYSLFTPMLREVAAGEFEQSTIINPLHRLLRRVKSFVGTIEAIDLKARPVIVSHRPDGHTHALPFLLITTSRPHHNEYLRLTRG
jgi:hypothetical protein